MKKVFLSTAMDYVNARPHLGHALEKIQADAIARILRRNNEVFFVSGTDENSLKNVKSAEKEGIEVKELVDKYSNNFFGLKELLNLSYDEFIRTTEKRHLLGAQKLWKACEKDIYKKKYKGLYCVGCEEFYKESELDEEGLCPEHKTKPEEVEEENYFFKLTNYQKQIEEIIEKDIVKIVPPERKNEVLSFVKSGLQDFCISRSSERAKGWGIDVPGDDTQKIWVWFDALSSYINSLGYAEDSEKFNEFWKEGEKIHVIGKGILRFHAVYWIGMLLSAEIELPSEIFVHGYITSEGQKMSKSLGNVVDPFEVVKKYGADPVRYFLLSEFSPLSDGDFSYEKLEKKYNADLSSGLGNLVSRTLAMIEKKELNGAEISPTGEVLNTMNSFRNEYEDFCSEFQLNDALGTAWRAIAFFDKYIDEKKPWDIEEKEKLIEIFSNILIGLRNISYMLEPFLPETSQNILEQIGDENTISIKRKDILFPRL